MKSSSGAHFIGLDHIRALAAFMVVAWHFTHGFEGSPVPFEFVPAIFPFALLDEGHTGVALFMTLSGYLFTKLLDGQTVNYSAFFWNRVLRLVPLLAVVIAVVGVASVAGGTPLSAYLASIVAGAVLPTLPNGGWSITVEFHYYLILPLLLWMLARSRWLPLSIVVAALAVRALLYLRYGEMQSLAYWTLIGRIDQFALGTLAYEFRAHFAGRHLRAAAIFGLFAAFYWYFDRTGGFYLSPSYPSPSAIWLILPTIEGGAYAAGIAWYDNSFAHPYGGVSRFVGRIGEYSYSIYLLHVFVVFSVSKFVHGRIMDLSNFYLACSWAMLFFLAMMPIGYLSFRFIESPFLRLRRPYTLRRRTVPEPVHSAATR